MPAIRPLADQILKELSPELAKLYVADGRASHVARKKSSGAIKSMSCNISARAGLSNIGTGC